MFELMELGYVGLFIVCFLAASILPIGSEVFMTYMFMNDYNYTMVIIVATVGNTLGAFSSYYLGTLGKWKWLEKYFKVPKNKVLDMGGKIKHYGSWLALLSWVPFIGDIIAVALGFFRVNFVKTAIFLFIGKAVRYIIWGLLSYYGIQLFSF